MILNLIFIYLFNNFKKKFKKKFDLIVLIYYINYNYCIGCKSKYTFKSKFDEMNDFQFLNIIV